METFRIVCPSCHGKLVIRHDWLLGKSIHCPRCKALVVVPSTAGDSLAKPGQLQPAKPTSYDSGAITRVDDGRLAEELAQALATPSDGLSAMDEQALASALDAFRTEDAGSSSPPDPLHDLDVDPQAASAALPLPNAEESNTPLGLDWDSPAIHLRRQILLIIMAGVAGLLLAGGGLIAFLSMRSTSTPSVKTSAADSLSMTEPNTVVQIPPQDLVAVAEPPEAPVPNPVESPALDTNIPPTSSETSEPAPEVLPAAQAPQTTPNDPSATRDNPATIDSQPPAAIPPGSSQPAESSPVSPIKPASDPLTQTDLPEAMRRMSGLFDPSSLLALPDALTVNQTAEAPREKVDVESLYHPPPIPILAWKEIRETAIPGLKFVDEPCNRALIVLGQLTAAGIGWDYESMRLVDRSIDVPITVDLKNLSLDQAIQQIAEAAAATVKIDEGDDFPRLRSSAANISQGLPESWSLADFIDDPNQTEAWRAVIERFLPMQSAKLRWEGRQLAWEPSASAEDQAILAGFLDQIRGVLGTEPQSKLPPAMTDPLLGIHQATLKLTQRGERVLTESMSLSQVLDVAARDVGIDLFFDWPSLFSHGFAHSVSGLRLLRGRTWSEIVEPTLDRFALVAVIDGPSRIVLTTLPNQRSIWRTVIVPVTEGTDLQKIEE